MSVSVWVRVSVRGSECEYMWVRMSEWESEYESVSQNGWVGVSESEYENECESESVNECECEWEWVWVSLSVSK